MWSLCGHKATKTISPAKTESKVTQSPVKANFPVELRQVSSENKFKNDDLERATDKLQFEFQKLLSERRSVSRAERVNGLSRETSKVLEYGLVEEEESPP